MKTSIKNLFVPYKIALLAKEKGFDEECLAHYTPHGIHALLPVQNNGINWKSIDNTEHLAAPLYQQLIDWFREKNKIHIYIDSYDDMFFSSIKRNEWDHYTRFRCVEDGYKDYYDCFSSVIKEAFKLIKS